MSISKRMNVLRYTLLVLPEDALCLSLTKVDDCSQHLQIIQVRRRMQIYDSSNSEGMTAMDLCSFNRLGVCYGLYPQSLFFCFMMVLEIGPRALGKPSTSKLCLCFSLSLFFSYAIFLVSLDT